MVSTGYQPRRRSRPRSRAYRERQWRPFRRQSRRLRLPFSWTSAGPRGSHPRKPPAKKAESHACAMRFGGDVPERHSAQRSPDHSRIRQRCSISCILGRTSSTLRSRSRHVRTGRTTGTTRRGPRSLNQVTRPALSWFADWLSRSPRGRRQQ